MFKGFTCECTLIPTRAVAIAASVLAYEQPALLTRSYSTNQPFSLQTADGPIVL